MGALHTTVLILHVLGATVIIGISFVTLVIELKKYSSHEILVITEFIWKINGILLFVQVVTGLYLAGSEWDKISKIHYFWAKMFLFFVIGTFIGIISRRRLKRMKEGKKDIRGGSNWAVVGFLTFLLIATLGVLIAESAA